MQKVASHKLKTIDRLCIVTLQCSALYFRNLEKNLPSSLSRPSAYRQRHQLLSFLAAFLSPPWARSTSCATSWLLKAVAVLHDQIQVVRDQVQEHEERIDDLEVPAVDQFRLPTWTQIEGGVVLVASAATCLDRLKAAVLPPHSSMPEPAAVNVADSFAGPISRQLPRVALTSISGEGGVGKNQHLQIAMRG